LSNLHWIRDPGAAVVSIDGSGMFVHVVVAAHCKGLDEGQG